MRPRAESLRDWPDCLALAWALTCAWLYVAMVVAQRAGALRGAFRWVFGG
jgi:hypothetical protein